MDVALTPTRRPRRDKRRERNRLALLGAAVELILRDGPGALAPLRVAERAGLQKSAFYAHFADVDDCLRAVVTWLTQVDLTENLKLHKRAFEVAPPDDAAAERAIELSLQGALANTQLYLLLANHCSDQGILGRALRDVRQASYDGWFEILCDFFARYGVGPGHIAEIRLLAEQLVDGHSVAILRVLELRDRDLSAAAARMQRYNKALILAELRRMLGLTPIAGTDELRARREALDRARATLGGP